MPFLVQKTALWATDDVITVGKFLFFTILSVLLWKLLFHATSKEKTLWCYYRSSAATARMQILGYIYANLSAFHRSSIAQLVEHWTNKPTVPSSKPTLDDLLTFF